MKTNQFNYKNYYIKGTTHRFVENGNGLKMHILDSGFISPDQDVVLLLHGFPEIAFSWRYIINPLILLTIFQNHPIQYYLQDFHININILFK